VVSIPFEPSKIYQFEDSEERAEVGPYRCTFQYEHKDTSNMCQDTRNKDEPDDFSISIARVGYESEVGQTERNLESEDARDVNGLSGKVELQSRLERRQHLKTQSHIPLPMN
jgi:hypothetical protein